MAAVNYLYTHLTESFVHYSTHELIALNNEIIRSNWGSTRGTFRTALLHALSKRGLDLSSIISKADGFTTVSVVPVRLEENRLVPSEDDSISQVS